MATTILRSPIDYQRIIVGLLARRRDADQRISQYHQLMWQAADERARIDDELDLALDQNNDMMRRLKVGIP